MHVEMTELNVDPQVGRHDDPKSAVLSLISTTLSRLLSFSPEKLSPISPRPSVPLPDRSPVPSSKTP